MQDFNDIQQLWKQNDTSVSIPKMNLSAVKNTRQKMKNKELFLATVLIATGIIILIMAYFLDFRYKTSALYISMGAISLICFIQAVLLLLTVKKIAQINAAAPPSEHLKQWQEYNEFRKKQIRWNMPVYYLLLGSALVIYLLEVLKDVSITYKLVALFLTFGWMFFTYFYLGKKSLAKTDLKINTIISELQNLEKQFK
ncbi:hypothetical protein OZ664_14010 [Elizabethkingia sp. HX WHF]|uniref:Uncharacterized protein n=1 Tax=Elizabethkingia bruuniana TaxID=1756149 RepID=A0A7T7UVH8_9FLAO|nr:MULTISPECIES: hypothetical protein [Elizabethkingia]ATL43882.1 hypothetical protein CQS02_11505 [Elizabethkingia miricola]AQX83588.1 hypothetical protein AYC65_00475 [Elizabethkingia bruuniana]KGO11851.1 hypothetical protein KS04_01490 [Elizabethkingia miricola]KUY22297.1 hypothetical protein ATB97_13720 [Elizabethkingia bruuniana]MCL1637661.1 hypothetical protein [Elizabethkingia bruuniana]